MRDRRTSQYLLQTAEQVARQTERSREITRRSVEILKEPMPDTFLGRKTHDPFPHEKRGPIAELTPTLRGRGKGRAGLS